MEEGFRMILKFTDYVRHRDMTEVMMPINPAQLNTAVKAAQLAPKTGIPISPRDQKTITQAKIQKTSKDAAEVDPNPNKLQAQPNVTPGIGV